MVNAEEFLDGYSGKAGRKVSGYYNLQGQRVTAPTKGLYIIDGKKVIRR
jgi:hypothetical protein